MLWELAEDEPYATLNRPGEPLAWSPAGDRLAVGATGSVAALTFWDPDATRRVQVLPARHHATAPVAWSLDGARLATARPDSKVDVWDTARGALVATLTGHSGKLTGVAWSPEGDRLATADRDGVVVVTSLADPRRATRIRLEPVWNIAWTSAGLAAASATGVVVFEVR
jgi:WD40 repeat protein